MTFPCLNYYHHEIDWKKKIHHFISTSSIPVRRGVSPKAIKIASEYKSFLEQWEPQPQPGPTKAVTPEQRQPPTQMPAQDSLSNLCDQELLLLFGRRAASRHGGGVGPDLPKSGNHNALVMRSRGPGTARIAYMGLQHIYSHRYAWALNLHNQILLLWVYFSNAG